LVLVSINCITYNHEKYIADAIEGFLMQKTNFKYEILIHDDASTDRTAHIIKEYERKYPDIIKPIYQKENQYSKGISVGQFNISRAKGKYIADCEGDDFWVEPYKLQKQIDYMLSHPNCTMCFHNANITNEKRKTTNKLLIDKNVTCREFNAGELAVLGFIPTASRVYLKSAMEVLPEWYFKSVVKDYPSQLIIASRGYAYYINEVMSSYRTGHSGSATARFYNKKTNEKIIYINGFIDILNNFNKYTHCKYFEEVEEAIINREVEIILLRRKIEKINDYRYSKYCDELKRWGKIKLYSRYYFPKLYMYLACAKEKIMNMK